MNIPTLVLYAQNGCNDFVFNIPFSLFQANYQGQKLFDFAVCSDNGKAIISEFGAKIAVGGDLSLMDNADIIVISGWVGEKPSRAFMKKLQTAHQNGKKIIGLCYGTFVLAFADILQGKTVVTHWAGEREFKQKFPHIQLDSNRLYIDDGNILTSAGAFAGLDCCLYFIRTLYGAKVANELARNLVSAPHREGGQAQFSDISPISHAKDEKINELLQFLSNNLADNHKLDDLANSVHLSKRSFNRYFKTATQMTLSEWLTAKRLAKVQEYLESTDLPIEIIADKTGFGTASNLRMQFKARFGVSPQSWRRSFQTT
ncbi:GlxA family transcriptional regulator [Ursidibacter arcticus]